MIEQYDRLRKLQAMGREDQLKLIFQWVKTGVLSQRQYLWVLNELDLFWGLCDD